MGPSAAGRQVLAGRYRLEERLGGGGMSVVWRASDQVLNRQVAVKVVAARDADVAVARERIRTEAKAAAGLVHPHLTRVLAHSESASDPYLVMELLDGQTLAQRLREGPLPAQTVLEICAQVADALATVHAHGVVHRDVKPGNVMVTSSGAVLLDLGIAAFIDESPLPSSSSDDDSVWGTPGYVAPELLTQRRVVPASDVYALGVLLYRALTGRRPWPAEGGSEMLAAHISQAPEPLPADAGVPPEVATLCDRCLAKEPEQRPTARAMATVLAAAADALAAPTEAAADAAPVAADAPPVVRRLPRRRIAALAASSTALAAAAAMVLTFCAVSPASGPNGSGAAPVPPPPGAPPPGISRAPGTVPGSGPPIIGPQAPARGALPVDVAAERDSAGQAGGEPEPGGPAAGAGTGAGGGATTAPATKPAAKPSPSPAPLSPKPVTRTVERTLSTLGGTVVARCVGSTASLVSWTPLAGFGIGEVHPGPAAEVGIVFHALLTDVSVTVRCVSGVPEAAIEVG